MRTGGLGERRIVDVADGGALERRRASRPDRSTPMPVPNRVRGESGVTHIMVVESQTKARIPDTYFRAIYNSEGRYQSSSYNDNFEGSRDSQVTFTPRESGTYYARVSGDRDEVGSYTLSVTDVTLPEAEAERVEAVFVPGPPETELETSPGKSTPGPGARANVPEGGTEPRRHAARAGERQRARARPCIPCDVALVGDDRHGAGVVLRPTPCRLRNRGGADGRARGARPRRSKGVRV